MATYTIDAEMDFSYNVGNYTETNLKGGYEDRANLTSPSDPDDLEEGL